MSRTAAAVISLLPGKNVPINEIPALVFPALLDTLIMVGIVMFIVVLVGIPLGALVHNLAPGGLVENPALHTSVSWVVSIGRSLPFLILMAAIVPFTRFITGTNIGIAAAVVPMSIAGIAFFTRIVENSLRSVPLTLLRVAKASGASPLQIVRTAQLSEALPSIIGGLTINTIAMIEYSAIAGTIGAGGIGYVAVTYGYQRFDNTVMLATIVILVATVASVQLLGDRMVRLTTPDIFIADEVAPTYGIDVEFKGLADSNTINRAVSEGEIAGTVYQHKLWLSQVLEANPDFKETAAVPVFRWGFGLWSDKYSSVDQVPDGATVSLYSDPANEAQGLWLLQEAGLITLKHGTTAGSATQEDIATNPKNLKFTLLDFAAQSRALPDLDLAAGYTEYYLAAGIPIEEQIFAPVAPDEFAGQLTIGSDYADTENIKRLVAAFSDPAVQEFLATDPRVKDILLPIDAR